MFKNRFERALHSRVARRLGLAFILSATLPLAGLAVLTIVRTWTELEAQARESLRADAKSVANDGISRLVMLAERLELASENIHEVRNLFETLPALLVISSPQHVAWTIPASTTSVALNDGQREHLRDTGRLLIPAPAGTKAAHLLIVASRPRDSGGFMAATVDEASLFGLNDESSLPAATDACVTEGRRILACSSTAPEQAISDAISRDAARDAVISDGADQYLMHVRALPLAAVYGSDPWRLVMVRSLTAVREPIRRFSWDFLLVAALSMMVVTWVSLSQVRKQLRPLDLLMEATERLKQRDFRPAGVLASGDEFQELGEAFNSLSTQLATQFSEIEAFSLGTLDTLARAIDAKSHWTAGHSDRVTAMAVAIGEAMGLPEDEMWDLRCGGPVHDIGKLATPVEILDKPGQLTPEEFEIMKQHTTKGVHILEPIPAFRRLLPIVGQHHERWDGRGYPQGLKETEIARTARVLAVADVFDAMQSDRPYRRGLPEEKIVGVITAGAGSHFDPAAVEAFLKVMLDRPAPDNAVDAQR